MQTIAETPVFILCGGMGTRIKEETEYRPKPMVPIGERPILWHIMQHYHQFGFRRFILCLGFKSEIIKSYFLHYPSINSDFTIDLKNNTTEIHFLEKQEDWIVTLADTGAQTMTGARLALAAHRYLSNVEHVAVTYGDGLTNAHLGKEFAFHLENKKIGTVLGVNPPSRFGEMEIENGQVIHFSEKPEFKEKWVNGGFFFFQRRFFTDYLTTHPDLVLEKEPLTRLANDNELAMYPHRGFWACMDTQRDRDHLQQLWQTGQAPWAHKIPSIELTHAIGTPSCN